jgi:serine/threonine-protein kinase
MLPHRLTAAEGTAPTGSIIAGRYRLERVLGVGGMGVVYLAKHLVLGEHVALKFMLPRYASMPDACARFVIEARSLFRISSPYVVRVLDIGEAESGAPYIAMEYVDGIPLRETMDASRIDVAAACEIGRQICEGLASSHALGIVHRDVKPSNILVSKTKDGTTRVRILDFGIARETETDRRLTATSTVIGTLAYSAPEQLRSTQSADARSDVWSIGAVLYELLTRRLPYSADSAADLVLQQLGGPPRSAGAFAPAVPAALASLVERCLTFDPDRRPTALDLAANLATFARPASLKSPAMRTETPPLVRFRQRKVMNTSGATAFVMHEAMSRPNATEVLSLPSSPSSSSLVAMTTTRTGYEPASSQLPPWVRTVIPALVAAWLVIGLVALGVSSRSFEDRAARLNAQAALSTFEPLTTRAPDAVLVPLDPPAPAVAPAPAPPISITISPTRTPRSSASAPKHAASAAPATSAVHPARVVSSPLDLRL